jgi:shikimate kinase
MILIGYRGTGKTTVAGVLGGVLSVPVVDSDREIELECGCSVSEIFACGGEGYFRDIEERVIGRILDDIELGKRLILSGGGGAILRETTRARFKNTGNVIWLKADPETILKRIQKDSNSKTTRPSLTSLSPLEEIRAVLEKRRPLYEQTATITINTDNKTPEQIAEQCLLLLKKSK